MKCPRQKQSAQTPEKKGHPAPARLGWYQLWCLRQMHWPEIPTRSDRSIVAHVAFPPSQTTSGTHVTSVGRSTSITAVSKSTGTCTLWMVSQAPCCLRPTERCLSLGTHPQPALLLARERSAAARNMRILRGGGGCPHGYPQCVSI